MASPRIVRDSWATSGWTRSSRPPTKARRRCSGATQRHHDQRLFLAQFRQWIRRYAAHRRTSPRDRRLHPRHGHAAVDVDASSICRLRPTPTAPSCTRARGRASPSRWPMRCAGCWRRAVRFSTCSNWKSTARKTRWLPRSGGTLNFFTDLCHVQAARAAGEVGRICAELVFGYNRHPAWDTEGYAAVSASDELDALEG